MYGQDDFFCLEFQNCRSIPINENNGVFAMNNKCDHAVWLRCIISFLSFWLTMESCHSMVICFQIQIKSISFAVLRIQIKSKPIPMEQQFPRNIWCVRVMFHFFLHSPYKIQIDLTQNTQRPLKSKFIKIQTTLFNSLA